MKKKINNNKMIFVKINTNVTTKKKAKNKEKETRIILEYEKTILSQIICWASKGPCKWQ